MSCSVFICALRSLYSALKSIPLHTYCTLCIIKFEFYDFYPNNCLKWKNYIVLLHVKVMVNVIMGSTVPVKLEYMS